MNKIVVCVTGASGFVGSELIAYLANLKYHIRVLTRSKRSIFPEGIDIFIGDLRTHNDVIDKFLANCDVLFHCAGEIHQEKLMEVLHVHGTKKLIQAVARSSKHSQKFIHWVQLSSVGVYGPDSPTGKALRVVTENTPLNPVGAYEITKAKSDELVVEAGKGGAFTYTILRPSNIFGRKMPNQSLYSLIKIIRKRLFFYIGISDTIATYIHVNDVVRALYKCAFDIRAKQRIYNLSYDCQWEELITFIAYNLGVSKPFLRTPEYLTRYAVKWIGMFIKLPLTPQRIDALTNRTKYPSDKILRELEFECKHILPWAINDLIVSIPEIKKIENKNLN
jgi:nucleoside-diphosphate-sugar epimerase